MGLYVVLGVLVLLATWYLWRARPEDDSSRNLPPGLVLDQTDRSSQRVQTANALVGNNRDTAKPRRAAAPTSPLLDAEADTDTDADDDVDDGADADADANMHTGTDWRQTIDRLRREPSYRIKPGNADCQRLIDAGVDSLSALHEAVVRDAKRWVHLYSAMAVVAEGLGDAGRDAVADQLANAVAQHHGRMTSFLTYVSSAMKPALVEALCARVNIDNASAFGEAAAHHGEAAFGIVAGRLEHASLAQRPALQQMLASMLASISLSPKSLWKKAVSHASPLVRAAAAQAGQAAKGQKAEAALRALANDSAEAVRHAFVVEADEIPAATLLRLTKDESPRVRAAAAWKLDGDDAAAQLDLQRLLADPHPAVALMAAVSLDHTSAQDRIVAGLASRDAILRECATRVVGFLPKETFCPALRDLAAQGSVSEIAAAVGSADDEPEPLAAIAELMQQSPAEPILHAGEIQLAFSDCPAAIDLAASLLSPQLPARVRRAGFYSLAPHRSAWGTKLGPYLHPDEPLLPDLIAELDTALIGDEPVDQELFRRIKERYPEGPLSDFADEALAKA